MRNFKKNKISTCTRAHYKTNKSENWRKPPFLKISTVYVPSIINLFKAIWSFDVLYWQWYTLVQLIIEDFMHDFLVDKFNWIII